ncbi:hypothetical protein JTE90_007512 [Oedothorax gibbosus]|uniref:Uncharacterized protein n=1 Tax=Oedothorax gibbosus TaxID=931172 RepID=A0AAV6VKS0_9ARAC|nr:hypothetical protein JTE90_007512 [Oedothorax gibbosus]
MGRGVHCYLRQTSSRSLAMPRASSVAINGSTFLSRITGWATGDGDRTAHLMLMLFHSVDFLCLVAIRSSTDHLLDGIGVPLNA